MHPSSLSEYLHAVGLEELPRIPVKSLPVFGRCFEEFELEPQVVLVMDEAGNLKRREEDEKEAKRAALRAKAREEAIGKVRVLVAWNEAKRAAGDRWRRFTTRPGGRASVIGSLLRSRAHAPESR